MKEELIGKVFEMISTAGIARSKYIEAISAAKTGEFDRVTQLIKEGSDCFVQAHHVHAELLAADAANIEESGEQSNVSLILVHAEDQMMAAETFRLIAEEFIDVHKKLNDLQ